MLVSPGLCQRQASDHQHRSFFTQPTRYNYFFGEVRQLVLSCCSLCPNSNTWWISLPYRWEVMFWSLRGLSKTSPHHREKVERRRFLPGALHSGACFRSQQQQLSPLPPALRRTPTDKFRVQLWTLHQFLVEWLLCIFLGYIKHDCYFQFVWIGSYWLNGFPRRSAIFWCIPCWRNDGLPGTGLPNVRAVYRRGEVSSRLGNYCLEGLVPRFSTCNRQLLSGRC